MIEKDMVPTPLRRLTIFSAGLALAALVCCAAFMVSGTHGLSPQSIELNKRLIQAVESDDADAARAALAKGADPNVRKDYGPTSDNRSALSKLAQSVGLGKKDRPTALMIAAGSRNPGITRLLLENGARPSDEDRRGITASWYAETAKLLSPSPGDPASVIKILNAADSGSQR